MRFSAISSRVKSWVSSSTFDGSLETAAGRVGVVEGNNVDGVELQRKTLPKDCQKVELELGIEPILRELERSESTVALTLYAIAGRDF